jgi:glucosamine--fructose-6-phosphate aminotransferase (isomerizing)
LNCHVDWAEIQLAFEAGERKHFPLDLPSCGRYARPILEAVPLQLLAYHMAVLKGTDIDQPRNLAKSVTVE